MWRFRPASIRPQLAARLGPARYLSQKKTPVRMEKQPRIRYLFLMVCVSFGALHFVTTKVDRKAPKTSFSEKEFEQYEKETGLRRRTRLIPHEKNNQYTFYAVPYAASVEQAVLLLQKALGQTRNVKVIDPQVLLEKELEDEGRYSYLLQEIRALGRQMPVGLLTALVKQEVALFTNTTNGQYDTNIVLVNYPQSTEEAIKFENDVSDIEQCVVMKKDLDSAGPDLGDDGLRRVANVIGYFDTVDKVRNM